MQNPLYPSTPSVNPDWESYKKEFLQTPSSAAPEVGIGGRLAYGAMMAVPRALEGITSAEATVGNLIEDQLSPSRNLTDLITPTQPVRYSGRFLPPESELTAANGIGQQLADLGGGLAPVALQVAATGGIAGPVTEGMGALASRFLPQTVAKYVPTAARMVTGAAEFGQLGLSQNAQTGAEQAGEGGAMGLITGILSKSNPWRIAAAGGLGLLSKFYFDSQDNTPQIGSLTRGTVQGTATALATAFLGKPFSTSHAPGEIPTKVATVANQFDPEGIHQPFGSGISFSGATVSTSVRQPAFRSTTPELNPTVSEDWLRTVMPEQYSQGPVQGPEYPGRQIQMNSDPMFNRPPNVPLGPPSPVYDPSVNLIRPEPASPTPEVQNPFFSRTPRMINGVEEFSPAWYQQQEDLRTSNPIPESPVEDRSQWRSATGPVDPNWRPEGAEPLPQTETPIPASPEVDPTLRSIFDPANETMLRQIGTPDSATLGNRQVAMARLQRALDLRDDLTPVEKQEFINRSLHDFPNQPETILNQLSPLEREKFLGQGGRGSHTPLPPTASEEDALQSLQSLLKPPTEPVLPAPAQEPSTPSVPAPKVTAPLSTGELPIVKMAKSPNNSVEDITTELGYYSPKELRAIAKSEGIKGNKPEKIAAALKDKYGPVDRPPSYMSHDEPSGKFGRKDDIDYFKDQGGFRSHELDAAMGRATFGALVGGVGGAATDDPGSHKNMVLGAIGGALIATFGSSILRMAAEDHAAKVSPELLGKPLNEIKSSTTVGVPRPSIGQLLSDARARILQHPKEASFTDRAAARLGNWFNANDGPTFQRIKAQAEGPITYISKQIDDAFTKQSFIKMDDVGKNLTNKFLDGAISKDEYLTQMSVDSERKAFADFAISARAHADALIEIGAKGQGDAGRSQMMRDSVGKYLTRSFKMFLDDKFNPSTESTETLARKIVDEKIWGDDTTFETAKSSLDQWVQDVKQQKGLYRGGSSESSKRIDQTAFFHRDNSLAKEWKDFLGEVTDPVDRIRLSVLKLKPIAEASNFFSAVVNGASKSDEGLPLSYASRGELEAAQQKILQALQTDPNNPQFRRQATELAQYNYVATKPSNGALQGRLVHANVADVITNWENSVKADSAATRTMMMINKTMKANVTYRNPMSILRQVVSSPFFLTVGRGWGDLVNAKDILLDTAHPLYKEMVENGITHVDSITRDVLRDIDSLSGGLSKAPGEDGAKAFLGRVDGMIGEAGARIKWFDSKLAAAFKFPDQVVRSATYLSAKTRFAQQLGLALDHPDIINKAVEFTNRYTMNYNMLPKAVTTLRNVPFVNLFISYAGEMTRILKNLGEDLIKGDSASRLNAIMSLGTMLVLPEAIQKSTEAGLSPKDRKDWEKVKAGMPTYLKDRFYFVSGRDQKTGKFRVYDFNNILPAELFQQTIRALADGRPMDALKNNPVIGWDNNPALNITTSLAMGEDRFTGRKFRGPTDIIASAAKEIGGPLTPGTGSQWRAGELAFGGITDKKGRTMSPGDFAWPWLTTVKAQNIDLSVIQQNAIADYKSNRANEMAYYNDIQKSKGYSPEAKAKAAARTKEALQQLQNNLRIKLGIEPSTPSDQGK